MRTLVKPGLWLAVLLALLVVPALRLGGRVLGQGQQDMGVYFYWVRDYGFSRLAHGELPLWNPYVFGGAPYLANQQTALFYPPNWTYLVLPTGLAMNFCLLFHLWVGGMGMFRWARRNGCSEVSATLAGTAYALGAYPLWRLYAGHLTLLCVWAWLPFILSFWDDFLTSSRRQSLALTTGSFALAYLAGSPQLLFYVLFAMGIWALGSTYRRWRGGVGKKALLPLGGLALAGVISLLVSCVQLLPTEEISRETQRWGARGPEFATAYSWPWFEGLVLLFSPHFLGDQHTTPYWGRWLAWEVGAYFGVVALVLALVGLLTTTSSRRRKALLLIGAALLLAPGKYAPWFPLLTSLCPGYGWFRGHAKAMILLILGGSLAAGWGAEQIIAGWSNEAIFRKVKWGLGVLLALLCFCSLPFLWIMLTGGAGHSWWRGLLNSLITSPDSSLHAALPLADENYADAYRVARTAFGLTWFWLLVSAAVVLYAANKLPKQVRGWALLVLVAAELLWAGHTHIASFDPAQQPFIPPAGLQAALQKPLRQTRTLCFSALANDWSMSAHLEDVGGVQPDLMVWRRYALLLNRAQGKPPQQARGGLNATSMLPCFDWLGVRSVLLGPDVPFQTAGLKPLAQEQGWELYENPFAFPRAWVVPRVHVAKDMQEAIEHVSDPAFAPRDEVWLETTAGDESESGQTPPGWSATAEVQLQKPEELLADVTTSHPGVLVLGEMNYPGWNAWVDGQPAPLYTADVILRAVPIPAGRHAVRLAFQPASFRRGLVFSLLGVVALGLLGGGKKFLFSRERRMRV